MLKLIRFGFLSVCLLAGWGFGLQSPAAGAESLQVPDRAAGPVVPDGELRVDALSNQRHRIK